MAFSLAFEEGGWPAADVWFSAAMIGMTFAGFGPPDCGLAKATASLIGVVCGPDVAVL